MCLVQYTVTFMVSEGLFLELMKPGSRDDHHFFATVNMFLFNPDNSNLLNDKNTGKYLTSGRKR